MSDERKQRTSKGILEHYCLHPSCKAWGMYGFKTRYGQLWFCHEHKEEGEKELAGGVRDKCMQSIDDIMIRIAF